MADPSVDGRANADAIVRALRRRHQERDGFRRPWTCVEEFYGIDFLALAAWPSASTVPYARIGYEIKVSRSDMRRELLAPWKREAAVAFCHEFYFAVPRGLLARTEVAWLEPDHFASADAFEREPCPGHCYHRSKGRERGRYADGEWVTCATCGGRGYLAESRVEREAPTLWVPRDVGLVEISGARCRVVRRPPFNDPRSVTSQDLAYLARHVANPLVA